MAGPGVHELAMGGMMHNLLNPQHDPGPPYVHTFAPPEPVILTAADPEPPPGTVVCDKHGVTWERYDKDDGGYWTYARDDDDGHMHPERWAGIAGERGPVAVLEEPGPALTRDS